MQNKLLKLLIVDDEEPIRRLLRLNLGDRYKIVDTGSPDQALALAMQDKPDAILLDLGMPKFSGFELCRTFSSLTSTQLIPIFIVSGEAGAATKALCKELGATAYFEKPIDFDALSTRLASVLQTVRPERRSEVRVRLRVGLKLRGTDIHKKPFEELSITENVSLSGFLCGCTALLEKDSVVEVTFAREETQFTGSARLIHGERNHSPYQRYGFRFEQKSGVWILQ
ncbi:MAG: response regulator [Terriglobales bacterium]